MGTGASIYYNNFSRLICAPPQQQPVFHTMNSNNGSNQNTHTVSNLSAGLKSVSLSDQQQNELNHNLLQQMQDSSSSQEQQQQQQSRISQFFQNQPHEGYTLFSHRSAPNGFKVAIILSELNLPFNTIFLDFNNGEQRAPEFVTINPNARVPALIDHYNENVSIWESGAIILYLVSKYMKENNECSLWSDNLVEQSQINSWLFFKQVDMHL